MRIKIDQVEWEPETDDAVMPDSIEVTFDGEITYDVYGVLSDWLSETFKTPYNGFCYEIL